MRRAPEMQWDGDRDGAAVAFTCRRGAEQAGSKQLDAKASFNSQADVIAF